jgi:5-methylcytosine-specific restriction endonuclease McrA
MFEASSLNTICLGLPGRPCPNITAHTRCPDCDAEWRSARDYSGHWPAIRAQQLADEPDCRTCGAPATEVDHILRLRMGGTHDSANLQSLCGTCHRRKTASEAVSPPH